ncbi:efflux RND transporter periplasmic adaptor subunit [Candidatus Absconditicoccus praedator]|uniref:efflux RND transporter periplasmic adaptor subunit n=1 Tax=Candidatus Absconditicoccus praedator TaxID=2735562 RepID=UPI001E495543|nr:efflux RND transporter periplasmic adaptor subunit [Candidatus Absconditicoccus praedator]UFX83413.1 efflux RND transporter periplasmic adaptor subunit [Candidatus Absconditicoccus praedator]
MKKFLMLGMFILISTIYGCGVEETSSKPKTYQSEYEVSTGALMSEESYVGVVQPDRQTTLQPKVEGFIVNLNYEEGDFVRQGQPIANIDTNYASIAYDGIENTIQTMENLQQNTENMFEQQIEATRSQVQQAEENINIIQRQLEHAGSSVVNVEQLSQTQQNIANTQKENAQLQLDMAKLNLENKSSQLEQEEKSIYDGAESALRNSRNLSRNFLDFTDEILGVSDANKNKNNHFETNLSARKSSLKDRSERQWESLRSDYEEYIDKIDELDSYEGEERKEKTKDLLEYGEDFFSDLSSFSYLFYDVLDNSVSGSTFPQSKIDELKEKTTNYQSDIEDMIIGTDGSFNVGIQASLQNIDDFKEKEKSAIDELQNAIDSAEKEYNTAKEKVDQSEISSNIDLDDVQTEKDVLENQIEIANQEYEEAKNMLNSQKDQKQAELSEIQAQIDEMNMELDMKSQELDDSVIYAPFDGIITKKYVQIGQLVNPQVAMFEISSMEDLQIDVMVSESEMEDITEGDYAIAKTDFNEKEYEGYVSNIGPIVDEFSRTLPVEITLNETPQELRIGMNLDVFLGESRDYGLTVPYNKIRYDYGNSFVYKKKSENNFEKVFVDKKACSMGDCIVEGDIEYGDILR